MACRFSLLLLLLGAVALPPAAGLAAPATAAPTSPSAETEDARILHLLNRTSFGPAPGDIDRVRRMGIEAYIESQLSPQYLPPSNQLDQLLQPLPDLNKRVTDLAQQYQYPPDFKDLSEDERKALTKRNQDVVREFMLAKILRATLSPAQLQEVMVDFWFNHFNVFTGKGGDVEMMVGAYERDAIRPYALGKFRDLLLATARHPAMLIYLDNWLNTDPASIAARGKKIGINENYAREVMELHTLGVDSGYTQTDVTTLAHILTGWGVAPGPGWVAHATFAFDPRRHDMGDMIFLNTRIRGGGEDEVTDVLTLLAREPATAHHIAFQLAQYFVADQPPRALVDQLTAVYLRSDGDIAAMLRTLLHSRDFWDGKNSQNKFKPPLRYVVSALRASGVVPEGDGQMVYGAIGQMGEPLYRCLTPNGYANTNDQWLNSDALLKRVDFARGLTHFMPGNEPVDTIIDSIGQENWSANSIMTIRGADPRQRPILALSSPEFVYY